MRNIVALTLLAASFATLSLAAQDGAPTIEELSNATYAGFEDLTDPVMLKDGKWEGAPYDPGGASRPSVTLAPDFRVVGDLDGDGTDEAVVVLAQSSGGSGTFNYVAAVKRDGAAVRNIATTPLGDRVQVRSARIENQRLLVSGVRAGEEDAACCPGELVDWTWTLKGRTFEAVGDPKPTGRLSLDILAQTEWVLRAWDRDVPAPAEPEVTLAYENGRFVGHGGCNRYQVTVTAGDLPGDLTVGPAVVTRMACPEAQTSVEDRFLSQIGGARKFQFMLGRLIILTQVDEAYRSMVFEARAARRTP